MVLWGVISFVEGKLPTLHLVQLYELLPQVLKDEKSSFSEEYLTMLFGAWEERKQQTAKTNWLC